MADIQTTEQIVKWTINGITIFLMILAAYLAIKRKNNICLGIAILGNLLVFYFTQSPLICWIVSVVCIIWASKTKIPNQDKQTLKTSESFVNKKEKMTKPGPIIGLILGIGLVVFPIIGFMIGEASLSDSKGKMIGFGFIIFGAIMVIINIIVLVTGKENLLASSDETTTTIHNSPITHKEQLQEEKGDKIRCRYCGKQYDSDYNGCPHCKKR